MKKLVLCVVIMVISLFARSQTYPLIAENNIIKVESVGWVGVNYRIKVTNKAGCPTSIRINYVSGTKDTTLSANAIATINLNGLSLTTNYIRVKWRDGASCISHCDDDYIYVGINNTVIPIRFKSILAKRISNDTIQINFEAEEDNTIDYYVAKISFDGKTYKEVTILMPNGVIGNKKYSITVKIRP
jgi:hypothetical protein